MSTDHQRRIATEAVVTGAARSLDDVWMEAAWKELPAALRARLVRANDAVERRPHDATLAATYQARVAEAVAYLCSGLQVAR